GGLVIIGTERHEARRIDRQLRGRSGRQGDPGQSVFFLSLEDDLMRLFGSDRIARWMDRTGAEEGEVITHPWVTSAIGQAQKRVELQNFQARKKLLEYDDVMNQQREVIYSLRLFALEGGEELRAEAVRMIEQAVERLADELIGDAKDAYQWDRALMETEFLLKFLISIPGLTDPAKIRSRDDLVRAARDAGRVRDVRRADAGRARDVRRALAQAADRDRTAAGRRGRPKRPRPASRSRERVAPPHAHGRLEGRGRRADSDRHARWPEADAGCARSEPLRRDRSQRPVPLRQRQKVQEVSRGGSLSAACGIRSAEFQWKVGRGTPAALTFRIPHSPLRIFSVPD